MGRGAEAGRGRVAAVGVAAGYFTVTVLQLPSLLFEEPGEPRNLLIVEADEGLADALDALQFGVAVVLLAMSVVIVVPRERATGGARREALRPVVWTGGVAIGALLLAVGSMRPARPRGRSTGSPSRSWPRSRSAS